MVNGSGTINKEEQENVVSIIEIARIQVRRGQENVTGIPQLAPGEFGWAQDTENLYIGKRIVEGASTDENSRILTQKDYDNLFALVNGAGQTAVATTSTYRYRDEIPYLELPSTTTTIAKKLDINVSLADFGVITSAPTITSLTSVGTTVTAITNFAHPFRVGDTVKIDGADQAEYNGSFTVTGFDMYTFTYIAATVPSASPATGDPLIDLSNQDIYQKLNLAVESIFRNSARGSDTLRRLLIPAGSYTVSSTVNLPPNTSLVGEGPGLTTLISESNLSPIFVTVDADNTLWNSTMNSAGKESKNVVLENMTLAYSSGTNIPAAPLLSLDNCSEAVLRNMNFTTLGLFTNTEYGTALRLRGQRRSGVEQSRNTTIENCNFNHIGMAIEATGTVVNPKITNCIFYNLAQGINFSSFFGDSEQPAPTGGVISNSTFENIYREAVFVSSSTNLSTNITNRVNHVSQNNYFKRVGNGTAITDGLLSADGATPILTFYGEGCRSISDEFSRREFADPYSNPSYGSFFYNPLMKGPGTIEGGGVKSLIGIGTSTTIVDRLYLSDKTQQIKIPYKLYNQGNSYSRSGMVTITLIGNPSYGLIPFGSLSDYYDFSYEDTWVGTTSSNFSAETGEPIEPQFKLLAPTINNSYMTFAVSYPVNPPDFYKDNFFLEYKVDILS